MRRVLPTRRGTRGSRPGMKGPGPRGKTKNDQEQWIFPPVKLEEWEKKRIIAEVIGVATKAMFRNHYYQFGGKNFHQEQGGPIGLRGTCAIARLVLQVFDTKWKVLGDANIRTWMILRYVDDCRAMLQPIRSGWRWQGGSLLYTKRWEFEDQDISGEVRTREIVLKSMTGIEEYLEFTVESAMDFEEEWLPTLDTSLKVSKDNTILYRFFEKTTTSSMTVQMNTAMEENTKMMIVAQDLVRRLLNSKESLGAEERMRVVDGYAQKLLNSGYSQDQTRRILVRGIKGYEGKVLRCKKEKWNLRRTSKESRGTRSRKRMLQKSSWYKSRKKENMYAKTTSQKGRRIKKSEAKTQVEYRSVLFVERTPQGELSKRLRETISRLAPILGFNIKVVERTGSKLKDRFSQANLWEGESCGRDSCTTCLQEADFHVPCSRKSAVYENVCALCNEGASRKEEIRIPPETAASLYVGETSRTIRERAHEHWRDYRGSNKEQQRSHIYKHQELQHAGAEARFVMRIVEFHKSALSRQTAEAVRIRRRGGEGSVLNSRSEYNRSYIPRLRLEEEDIAKELEKEEEDSIREASEEIDTITKEWERKHVESRSSRIGRPGLIVAEKRVHPKDHVSSSKRRKYDLLVGWGECVPEETKTTVGGAEANKSPEEAKTTVGGAETYRSPESQEVRQQEAKTPSVGGIEDDDMTNHPDRSGHPLLPDHPGILELDKSPGSPPATRGSLPGLAEAETAGQDTTAQYRLLKEGIGIEENEMVLSLTPEVPEGDGACLTMVGEGNIENKHQISHREEGDINKSDADTVTSIERRGELVCGETTKDDIRAFFKPSLKRVKGDASECGNDCEDLSNGENDRVQNTDCDTGGVGVISECNIDKKKLRCTNHDCGVEKIKVRSKKWGWIPRKSEYGYSNSQSTKYLCKVKRLGISAHRISTSIDNPEPLPVGLVGLIVGTHGGGENNGDESESSGKGTQWTEMSCYDGDVNQVDLKST